MALQYTKKEKMNIIIRIILVCFLAIIIGICIAVAINQLKAKEGLTKIHADYSNYPQAEGEYELYYYLDDSNGTNVSTKQLTISNLYSKSLDFIYPLLDNAESYENIKNIYYINHHPNEEIEINNVLYDYLYEIYNINSRYILSGNAMALWESFLYNINGNYNYIDPFINLDIANKIEEFNLNYLDYISISFKGDNKIILNVDENFKFLLEDGNQYINLSYVKEAIIMDYVKKELNNNHYYNGYIISLYGLLLDLGSNDSFDYQYLSFDNIASICSSLEIKSNYSYINIYNFYVSNSYPFYEIKDGENIIKRTIYMNVYDLYPNFDFDTLIYFSDSSIIKTLINALDFAYKNIINDNYIKINEKTILTNISNLKVDGYEVIYEN